MLPAAVEQTVLLRDWQSLENATIIKEVATKGKHIDLCFSFLSKRTGKTSEQIQLYFQQEINKYVERLLTNRQIYKAEHVLRNVSREPKWIFYEFVWKRKGIDTEPEEVQFDYVFHYFRKQLTDFEVIRMEWDQVLLMVNIIRDNGDLKLKYDKLINSDYVLEEFYKNSESIRIDMITEVFFTTEENRLISALRKLNAWRFILSNNQWKYLVFWLDVWNNRRDSEFLLHRHPIWPEISTENQTELNKLFGSWTVDESMEMMLSDRMEAIPEPIIDILFRYGIVNHRFAVTYLIRRIFCSNSWDINKKLIASTDFQHRIIDYLIENGYEQLFIENWIDKGCLMTFTNPENVPLSETINLAVKLHELSTDKSIHDMSRIVSQYLSNINGNSLSTDNSLVLCNSLLKESTVNLDESIDCPLLSGFLSKLKTPPKERSINVKDMFKTILKIDLETIDRSSDNLSTISTGSQNFQLNFIDYLYQQRPSFALYKLLIEQLQQFGQITQSHIDVVVSIIIELTVTRIDDRNLFRNCVALLEMLGYNTVNLRSFVQQFNETDNRFDSVLNHLKDYSLPKWLAYTSYRSPERTNLIECCEELARGDDWFRFVLVAICGRLKPDVVGTLARNHFKSSTIGENILQSIRTGDGMGRKGSISYRKRKKYRQSKIETSSANSGDTMSVSLGSTELFNHPTNSDSDLFAIILSTNQSESNDQTVVDDLKIDQFIDQYFDQSGESQWPVHGNLLMYAAKYDWPVLAVLAATQSKISIDYCWMVWITKSLGLATLKDRFELLDQPTAFGREIFRYSITNRFTDTLNQSIEIFYPEGINKIIYLTKFLSKTARYDFSDDSLDCLKNYLSALSTNQCYLPGDLDSESIVLLNYSIDYLLEHLQSAFNSNLHKKLFMKIVNDSGILDLSYALRVIEIIELTPIDINFVNLWKLEISNRKNATEFEGICDQLLAVKDYVSAEKLARLVDLPIDGIVFEKWIHEYNESGTIPTPICDTELKSPELLINFYIHISEQMDLTNPLKYDLLKWVMDLIKKFHLFPNEFIDRDRIESDMIKSYLHGPQNIDDVTIYHSEYFECIMAGERYVLYKSFMELKELAGIDDLNVVNKETGGASMKLEQLMYLLLDRGDIVQALRVQAMFNYRPLDLHFLVFCMALAEGLVNLYDLSKEQREMLNTGAQFIIGRFNRRILRSARKHQYSSSPPGNEHADTTDDQFEEIPSREKQDVLEALQNLSGRIQHGVDIAQRIVLMYRVAMYMDKEYLDVLKTKDVHLLLQNAINEDCLNKLLVINDIMQSMQMTSTEIADFIAEQTATSIIKSRFYLMQDQKYATTFGKTILWGYDVDKQFHLFLELCPNSSKIGKYLLAYCDAMKIYRRLKENVADPFGNSSRDECVRSALDKLDKIMENQVLSHKKLNTINVELLIKAHDCFVHECSIEGIAFILQRAKVLNVVLTKAKSWNLIVNLLVGIGRYRDMYYCFETLINNEQFESLLKHFNENQSYSLKHAIITYLHENHPNNLDNYRLAALHFSMYKEIAEMWETEAKSNVAKLLSTHQHIEKVSDDFEGVAALHSSSNLLKILSSTLDGYRNAAENYLLDNKIGSAQRAAINAELIALQINLVNKSDNGSDEMGTVCLLDIPNENVFKYLINNILSVPQSIILSHAYPFEINWSEALFRRYILIGDQVYLNDYTDRMDLTENIVESLVKIFQTQPKITKEMEDRISQLIERITSLTVRYRLASLLGLKKFIANLINNQGFYYLKDTQYGRKML